MLITDGCYQLGLRSLTGMFGILHEHQEDVLITMARLARDEYPDEGSEGLLKRARHTVTAIGHNIAYGIVKRISNAVGSRDLTETFKRVLSDNETPAVLLVDTSIKLDHLADFPGRDAVHLGDILKGNPFSLSLLQRMVVQHLYLFPVPYKIKQSICDTLGISYRRFQATDPRRKLIGGPGTE